MAGGRAGEVRRRLAGLAGIGLVVLCVLVLVGSSAAQIDLNPTDQPLPGSQFQGGDGNQNDALGYIDWQGLQADGRVGHTSDPQVQYTAIGRPYGNPDNIFAGGAKELDPDRWGLTTRDEGPTPASSNILDFYHAVDQPTPGGDVFLYLAFTRASYDGPVFATFEINQDDRLWTNAAGARIPCRTTGDILISFEPYEHAGATISVDRWVSDTTDAATGCAKTGHLETAKLTSDQVQGSLGGNFLFPPLPGFYHRVVPPREFGEAAINVSSVLSDLGHPCGDFTSVWMQSRSSSSFQSAELKDYVAPARIDIHTCKASPRLSSTAFGPRDRIRVKPHLQAPTSLDDHALLEGSRDATGTITFRLYGPDDPTCAGAPVFTSVATVRRNPWSNTHGQVYPSQLYQTDAAGTFRWRVEYSGDVNNERAGPTACGDPSETTTIERAKPHLSSTASGPEITSGPLAGRRLGRAVQPIYDTATLANGRSPTGNITFLLYGPGEAGCTLRLFSSTVPVAGNGPYKSHDFTPRRTGVYRWVVSYSGDANNDAAGPTDCGTNSEAIVVGPAQPTIITEASPAVDLGHGIYDRATLSGGADPTGAITFKAYGPDDVDCSGAPAHTSTVDVSRGNDTYTSTPFTPTAEGTYRWVASYSGDGDDAGARTACGDAGESVDVAHPVVQPTIVTKASPSVPALTLIHDTATLSNGRHPTGTIHFELFGPNTSSCTGPSSGSTVPVDHGNGEYESGLFGFPEAGTYHWIATYSGDDNNHGAGPTACDDPAETIVVSRAPSRLRTEASSSVDLDAAVNDTAFLSGAIPTGTVTFRLYGPDDSTCARAPAFTTHEDVDGSGTYPSAFFTPLQAGTYLWVAGYSGDKNTLPATTACGADHERVVVSPRQPRLTTTANPDKKRVLAPGLTTYDTAHLSDGASSTGEIRFALYGPDDADCSGAPLFTTATLVNGNGTYNSELFTPTEPGTYRWVAVYSGDANNRSAGAGRCATLAETEGVIGPARPLLATAASQAVALGGAVHDTAILSDGANPKGTISFRLFAPQDTGCKGTPVFTSTVGVNGNGDYQSGSYTPTVSGAYRWVVHYSGDSATHVAGPTGCGASAEIAFVRPPDITPLVPGFSTTASASIGVGAPIHDVASLTGGLDPGGAVTFELFGPTDPTCSAAPVFTTTTAVTGHGDFSSATHIPQLSGTYRWVATYSGDALNVGVGPTACGASGETVTVGAELGPNIEPGPVPGAPTPKPKPKKPKRPIVIPVGRG